MKPSKIPVVKPIANGNGSVHKEPLDAAAGSLQNGNLSLEETIAITAYFRAEQRGFAPGNELADWLQAEAEYKKRSGPKMN
jgi:hypothetical protein